MNITKMTTVQQMTIPQIFSGKDVLIRSQTGSGKTLAYAIPIVECLHKIRPKLTRSSGLSTLVVVPTRELALQTYECFLKLRKVSIGTSLFFKIEVYFCVCLKMSVYFVCSIITAIYMDCARLFSRRRKKKGRKSKAEERL